MKNLCIALLASATIAAVAAEPLITQVNMTQGRKRIVRISYTLENAPAIITVDIQTNGVSIGDAALSGSGYLSGDVNRMVEEDGTYTISWDVANAWPDHDIPSGVRAVVSAWSPDTPPDVIVADLTSLSNVAYYTSIEALPGGLLANQAYRTSKIVMKKIHASGIPWTMGSGSGELGHETHEYAHEVTLTNDYFIGVFPVTQSQLEYIGSRNPSAFSKAGDKSMRPAEGLKYIQLRQTSPGDSTVRSANAYPNEPYAGSVVNLFRTKTGLKFEVPSEAQWEFACRAMNGDGKWGNGTSMTNATSDANLPGRYRYNQEDTSLTTPSSEVGKESGTAEVGSFDANGFGLYDMHGNVMEWTLDYYIKDRRTLPDNDAHGAPNANGDKDLLGDTKANNVTRIMRGGAWCKDAGDCRSAERQCPSQNGNTTGGDRGVRLVIVLD